MQSELIFWPYSADSKALFLSAGDHHTCAILSEGSMVCWGLNSNGQLGTWDTTETGDLITVNLGIGMYIIQHIYELAQNCLTNEI